MLLLIYRSSLPTPNLLLINFSLCALFDIQNERYIDSTLTDIQISDELNILKILFFFYLSLNNLNTWIYWRMVSELTMTSGMSDV